MRGHLHLWGNNLTIYEYFQCNRRFKNSYYNKFRSIKKVFVQKICINFERNSKHKNKQLPRGHFAHQKAVIINLRYCANRLFLKIYFIETNKIYLNIYCNTFSQFLIFKKCLFFLSVTGTHSDELSLSSSFLFTFGLCNSGNTKFYNHTS